MDILRHQSSPVQQGERNNTTVLTTSDGRMSKTLYTPVLQSKDNRSKWPKPQEALTLVHIHRGYNGSKHKGTGSVTVETSSATITRMGAFSFTHLSTCSGFI